MNKTYFDTSEALNKLDREIKDFKNSGFDSIAVKILSELVDHFNQEDNHPFNKTKIKPNVANVIEAYNQFHYNEISNIYYDLPVVPGEDNRDNTILESVATTIIKWLESDENVNEQKDNSEVNDFETQNHNIKWLITMLTSIVRPSPSDSTTDINYQFRRLELLREHLNTISWLSDRSTDYDISFDESRDVNINRLPSLQEHNIHVMALCNELTLKYRGLISTESLEDSNIDIIINCLRFREIYQNSSKVLSILNRITINIEKLKDNESDFYLLLRRVGFSHTLINSIIDLCERNISQLYHVKEKSDDKFVPRRNTGLLSQRLVDEVSRQLSNGMVLSERDGAVMNDRKSFLLHLPIGEILLSACTFYAHISKLLSDAKSKDLNRIDGQDWLVIRDLMKSVYIDTDIDNFNQLYRYNLLTGIEHKLHTEEFNIKDDVWSNEVKIVLPPLWRRSFIRTIGVPRVNWSYIDSSAIQSKIDIVKLKLKDESSNNVEVANDSVHPKVQDNPNLLCYHDSFNRNSEGVFRVFRNLDASRKPSSYDSITDRNPFYVYGNVYSQKAVIPTIDLLLGVEWYNTSVQNRDTLDVAKILELLEFDVLPTQTNHYQFSLKTTRLYDVVTK